MGKPNSGGNAATEETTATSFDALKIANLLQAAGVSEAQAEARVEAINTAVSGSLATKADLNALETRLTRWFVATLLAVSALVVAAVGGMIAADVKALIAALG